MKDHDAALEKIADLEADILAARRTMQQLYRALEPFAITKTGSRSDSDKLQVFVSDLRKARRVFTGKTVMGDVLQVKPPPLEALLNPSKSSIRRKK